MMDDNFKKSEGGPHIAIVGMPDGVANSVRQIMDQ